MKEKLTESLIVELLGILRSTKEFAVAQAPDIIRQILAWKTTELIIYIAVALAAMLPGFYLVYRGAKSIDEGSYEPCFILWFGFAAIFLIPSFCSLANNIPILLQVHLAPKIFLIEYLSGLLK